MNWWGIALIATGVMLTLRHPRLRPNLSRLRIRGLAGPAFVVLGILVLLGILPL